MKDDLGYPLAGVEELRERNDDLSAELAAAKSRIGELEQERGAEGTNWFPESFVIQLQDQLREVTERCNHFCKMALVPDGTESRKEIIALQAQLAAVQNSLAHEEMERDIARSQLATVTQENERLSELISSADDPDGALIYVSDHKKILARELAAVTPPEISSGIICAQNYQPCPECEALKLSVAAVSQERDTLKETLSSSEEYRRAYQAGKMALYSMGSPFTEAAVEHLPCGEGALDRRFTKLIEMPRIAQLQAHNKELRDALEKVVNERYSELDMQACGYSRGTSESEAWHQGVFSMCRQLKLIKAPAIAALTAEEPKP